MPEVSSAERATLVRRGRKLEYLTIGWNAVEGIVAIAAGAVAGSISLTAFGIDSFIELASGGALLWRMAVDHDAENRERNEKGALRIVGVCFLALAAYILYESGSGLRLRKAPERSLPGIVLACASLVAMPLLAHAKRKVGRELGSAAQRSYGCGRKTKRVLLLAVWNPARRVGAECSLRAVVGRCSRCIGYGAIHREGRR
jgi:divalent metal cation (Fe/Co/Zn/Cd) transporter